MKRALLAALLLATGCTVTTSTSTGSLSLDTPVYSTTADKSGERSDHKFKAGEEVHVLIPANGYKKDASGQAHIQADVVIKDSKGAEILKKDNIVDANLKPEGEPPIDLSFTFTIPPSRPSEEYKVAVTARDANGGATTTQNSSFNIESTGAAAAPDAAATPMAADTAAPMDATTPGAAAPAAETPAAAETTAP